ncbi:unnamed protein product [Chironomus riparius]|uniref:SHSP domain-containing protein n=1 Tax=Chironomus riparius TaxID=315576 RepID=A0A9N9S0X2_9DIPT|nr:unnamed protein product [Chironomus riparius]
MKYIMAYLPYGCNIFETPFDHEVKTSFGMLPRARSWSVPSNVIDSEPRTHRFDSKGFTAFVDVHLFDAKEVSVKTIDHTIVVECKHDSREDNHGSVERSFVRKFNLPYEFDMSLVTSTLSKEGILLLEAPKPQVAGEERKVEITTTEKPSFLMSLLSNRANSLMKRSHSIPSDEEDE